MFHDINLKFHSFTTQSLLMGEKYIVWKTKITGDSKMFVSLLETISILQLMPATRILSGAIKSKVQKN